MLPFVDVVLVWAMLQRCPDEILKAQSAGWQCYELKQHRSEVAQKRHLFTVACVKLLELLCLAQGVAAIDSHQGAVGSADSCLCVQ